MGLNSLRTPSIKNIIILRLLCSSKLLLFEVALRYIWICWSLVLHVLRYSSCLGIENTRRTWSSLILFWILWARTHLAHRIGTLRLVCRYFVNFSSRLKRASPSFPSYKWVFHRHSRCPPQVLIESKQPFQKIDKSFYGIHFTLQDNEALNSLLLLLSSN